MTGRGQVAAVFGVLMIVLSIGAGVTTGCGLVLIVVGLVVLLLVRRVAHPVRHIVVVRRHSALGFGCQAGKAFVGIVVGYVFVADAVVGWLFGPAAVVVFGSAVVAITFIVGLASGSAWKR